MAEFWHRSATADGREETGRVMAGSEAEATALLRRRGLVPLTLSDRPRLSLRELLQSEIALSSVPLRRKSQLLAENAATLLNAGLSVGESLRQAVQHSQDRKLAEKVRALATRVEGGTPLSIALSDAKFPDLMAAFVMAGELRGQIGEALSRYAELESASLEAREKTLASAVYPLFLCVATVVALTILMIWVVPVFKTLFEESGASIPFSTRILVALSDFVVANGAILAVGTIALVVAMFALLALPSLARLRETIVLGLPVIGRLRADVQRVRFMLTCGGLIEGGVAVPESLKIAASMLTIPLMRDQALDAAERVGQGERLGDVLRQAPLGSPLLAQFARIGERSGALAEMLTKAGFAENKRVSRDLAALTATLGPVLTLFVAVVIGGVAYSVLSAVLGAYDLG